MHGSISDAACFPNIFFRISSLAYPNLLGKKGYVVVVVDLPNMHVWVPDWVGRQETSMKAVRNGDKIAKTIRSGWWGSR